MILLKTHSNRWIVRERCTGPAIARITLMPDARCVDAYRTEAWRYDEDEHVLLRDSDCLEIAFALVIAHTIREQLERDRGGIELDRAA